MSLAVNTIFINKPIEEVFTFATTPKNWPAYHPNSLGVSGVTERPVQVGDVTRERASLMGRIGEGDWKVIQRDEPRNPVAQGKIVWTINNPNFKAHLGYGFEAKDGGTQFTRTLAYDVPFEGDTLKQFEQYMFGESEKAVQNLKRVMEGNASER